MAVAGLVYMGEYSSACVCEVPRTTGPRHFAAALALTVSH